jgi:hypothetical protein
MVPGSLKYCGCLGKKRRGQRNNLPLAIGAGISGCDGGGGRGRVHRVWEIQRVSCGMDLAGFICGGNGRSVFESTSRHKRLRGAKPHISRRRLSLARLPQQDRTIPPGSWRDYCHQAKRPSAMIKADHRHGRRGGYHTHLCRQARTYRSVKIPA